MRHLIREVKDPNIFSATQLWAGVHVIMPSGQRGVVKGWRVQPSNGQYERVIEIEYGGRVATFSEHFARSLRRL